MPFCPKCRTEYRPGYSECADCHTGLVPFLSSSLATAEEIRKDYSGFVAVLDTTDNFALNAAVGSLEAAEIPYVVDDEPAGVTSEVLAAKHKWWILACRILVPSDREEEARNLLGIFQHPTVPEIDPDSSV